MHKRQRSPLARTLQQRYAQGLMEEMLCALLPGLARCGAGGKKARVVARQGVCERDRVCARARVRGRVCARARV